MLNQSPWQFLKSRRTFYLLAVLGFLFKYWLVLGEEIEPFYRPADDLSFVQLAKSWYWWTEYNGWSLLRPPVWPLTMAVVDYTGIPLRLFQELLLCWACFFMVSRFVKNGLNAFIGGACFVLIILHPGWLLLANRTLRECFYVSLLMILVAQLVPLANKRLMDVRWYQLLPAGITSALLWYTREEAFVIAIMLTGFVFLFWIVKQELPRWSKVGVQLGWVFLGFMAPVVVAGLTVRTANYAAYGLFIPHEFAGPSWKLVLKRLMQIRPDTPKPWVSVEQECLEKAYAVSPTLASIKEALSGRTGPRWAAATAGLTKDPKEIAGSAFYFALREAAIEEGIHKDAVTAHRFYSNIDKELKAAFKAGKLPKRFVLTSYLDPEISDWFPRLPEGIKKIAGFAYKPLKDTDIRIYFPRYHEFTTLDLYDQVANRRYFLAYRKLYKIRGWAFLEGKEIIGMKVIDQNGVVLDSTANIYPRPDVAAAYQENRAPQNSGFNISLPKADYPGWDVKVVVETRDGSTASLEARNLLKHGQVQGQDASGTTLRLTVDEIKKGPELYSSQAAIQQWIWTNHGKFHLILGGAAVLVILVRCIAYKLGAPGRHYNRWILFIALIIISRSAIIVLMDISSFRIDLRYIFPALVFMPLLFGLIIQEGIAGFKSRLLRW
ncbi:MAG: hypothetical protein KJT03_00060 [Verrucomicrobiae bacterium]|nr:hypothetical protein [Verrucomicrobiae bacterium]